MWQNPEFFRTLLENLQDGVYFVDRQRTITYWNRGAERLSGYPAGTVLGKSCADNLLVHVDDAGRLLCLEGCPLAAAMADGRDQQAEVYLHHRDGHRLPVLVRASPIRGATGEILGAVEIFSDNSTRHADRRRIQELEDVAYLDPLTGLANRRFLEITLETRLAEMHRYGWPFALLFFDIDRFKDFNDRHGHEVGDRVLKMVAGTMTSCSRSFDTMGRWGGEEFVAVLANLKPEQIFPAAERLRQMIAYSSLTVDDQVLQVSVSVGATPARPGDTIDGLVERADALMYRSKQAGRNRVTIEGAKP